MLAPAGMLAVYESTSPTRNEESETEAAEKTTPRKLLKKRIEVTAGNIISPEMSSAPISLMPTAIVTPVSTAITMLQRSASTPVALAKSSSKVTAKILL